MIAKVYCKFPDEKPDTIKWNVYEPDIVEFDVWEIEGLVIIFKTLQPVKTVLYPLDAVKKVKMSNKDVG